MKKRLVVYSISNEKTRLEFEAVIQSIDKNCVNLIDQHAFAFHSDMTMDELFKVVSRDTGIECPPDEFWILTLDRPFKGIGAAIDDLKNFLLE